MSIGLRCGLRLLIVPWLIAGCASQLLMVPADDWATVPATQRAAVDKKTDATLFAASAELVAATTGLAEVKRTPIAQAPQGPQAPPAGTAPVVVAADEEDDDWAMSVRDHQRSRAAAFARVDAAKATWLRARLLWRERRVESAKAQLDAAIAERELIRGKTIDRNLLGTDTYEMAPLRGQFSRAQQRLHVTAAATREAQLALARASADLASAKEAYAQIIRNGPAGSELAPVMIAEERQLPRLELAAWTIQRSDIRRRRGLRRYLDETPSVVAQRGVALRPSIAVRTPQAAAAAPAAKPVPRPTAPATAPAPRIVPAPSIVPSLTPTTPPAPPPAAAAPAARPAAPTLPVLQTTMPAPHNAARPMAKPVERPW